MQSARDVSRADATEDSRASSLPDSMSDSRARPRWTKLAELLAMPGLVLGAAALSCVTDSPNTVICESGLICPAGWICVTGNEACMPKDCGNGVVDRSNGEVCDDGDLESGDGCSASCLSNEVCGNGIRDDGEACDDGNTQSNDGCRGDCLLLESCGDENLDPGEVCDDGNTMAGDGCSADCLHLEMCMNMHVDYNEHCDEGGDSANCDSDCTAPMCGDGHPNQAAGEECDNGGFSASCDDDCTYPLCGDGVVNHLATPRNLHGGVLDGATGEACDDGNLDDNDDCLTTCQLNTCGDRYRNIRGTASNLEACDEGGVDTETCNFDCTLRICGDGYTNSAAGESCDTIGNTDECDSDCTTPACGDGLLNAAAGEACDDGNNDTHDDCPSGLEVDGGTPDCRFAYCGDGFVHKHQSGREECDHGADEDGTMSDRAECDSDCTRVVCGDGHINGAAGEECDDGNRSNFDGCVEITHDGGVPIECKPASCGDGFLWIGEEGCDDGNKDNGDDCPDAPAVEASDAGPAEPAGNCQPAFCGDGFVNRSGANPEECETEADCPESSGSCNTNICQCE